MDGIWQDLFVSGIPIAEKVLRTILVYVFLVIGLRIFGKRELGQLNPLDMIILLLLSNTVQNAIIGRDDSLVGGLAGAAVLLVVNAMLVRFAHRRTGFRRLLVGRAEPIIERGQLVRHAIEANSLSRDEVVAAARKQGIASLAEVESARLEISGDITFTRHEGADATVKFRDEVLHRLSAIEKHLSTHAARGA